MNTFNIINYSFYNFTLLFIIGRFMFAFIKALIITVIDCIWHCNDANKRKNCVALALMVYVVLVMCLECLQKLRTRFGNNYAVQVKIGGDDIFMQVDKHIITE